MTRNNVPGLVSEEVGDAGFFSWGSRTILIQIMGKTQHWILEKDETVSNLVAVGFGKGEPKSPFWLVQARIHIKPDGGPVDCRLHWVQWRWLRRRPHPAADYWGTAASIATDRFDGRHGNEVESSVALALSRSISNQVFDLRNRTVLNGVFLTPVVKSFVGAQMTVPKMRWLLDEVTVSKMGKAGQSAEKPSIRSRFSKLSTWNWRGDRIWYPQWVENVADLGKVFPFFGVLLLFSQYTAMASKKLPRAMAARSDVKESVTGNETQTCRMSSVSSSSAKFSLLLRLGRSSLELIRRPAC